MAKGVGTIDELKSERNRLWLLTLGNAIFMSKAIRRTRKSRGRPSTGAESVHLRVLPDQFAAIDAWITKQKEPGLTRPEAGRRLVELGLTVKIKANRSSLAAAHRAKQLAAQAIDKFSDPAADSD
jgi:hypothetical protein